jgi:hypothetical protein
MNSQPAMVGRNLLGFASTDGFQIDYPLAFPGPPAMNDADRALRIYVEEVVAAPRVEDLSGWQSVCTAVQELTGWNLQWKGDGAKPAVQLDPADCTQLMARHRVELLADSLGRLVETLQNTRLALWEREAELAAGVPVRIRADEEPHLAARLESILRIGAQTLAASAVAAYLLDDATTELKLRSSWGLPAEGLTEPARPLRGAVADLEALLGHAVVLNDRGEMSRWKAPLTATAVAAVCVPISSPTMPLGTLWFYFDATRPVGVEQTNVAELVASRFATELEREVLLSETGRLRRNRARHDDSAEAWHRSRQPSIEPMVDGWTFAGWTTPWSESCGAFYDWSVLPDGQLALMTGSGHGKGDAALLNAAALHGMLKVLAQATPRQIAQAVSDSFWAASSGDQWASLNCISADPETGMLQACSAGNAVIVLIQSGEARIVGTHQPMLGYDPDHHYRQRKATLPEDGTLILCQAEGLDRQPEQQKLLQLIQTLAEASPRSAEQWVQALREDASWLSKSESGRTVQVVQRRTSTA